LFGSARCIPEPVPFAGPKETSATRLLRYGEGYGLDHLVYRGYVDGAGGLERGEHPALVLEQRLGLVPWRNEPDLWGPLLQALVLRVEPADLHFLPTGRAEHLVQPARASMRMDLSEASERLAQTYTPAGQPDDPDGACHLLALNYH
jgi:hypothetical protein